jgi:hypothetical protein
MKLKTLRKGSKGPLVREWQEFLLGMNLYVGEAHGTFDDATEFSTQCYQRSMRLDDDGVVGGLTWGAALSEGFSAEGIVKDLRKDTSGPNWPPPPSFKPLGQAGRVKLFGDIQFKPKPTKGNPEGIVITNSWQSQNLGSVVVPQLKGVKGAPKSGKVFWHKDGIPQLLALFQAWDDAGLRGLVVSWAGSWCPRFVRGSRTYLSNHSWATAFDINVPWNGLRKTPALAGKKGSVRELVPIANELGFFWGGHFSKRPDGMHFELAKIIEV